MFDQSHWLAPTFRRPTEESLSKLPQESVGIRSECHGQNANDPLMYEVAVCLANSSTFIFLANRIFKPEQIC